MRISRVAIENFRNFHHIDVELGPHAVIVGENMVGKSNFLFALRLILDPSLPDTARYLRMEDFWDGLDRPLKKNERITISVDLTDFEDDENQLAVLAEHLVESTPMVSRLTYVFQPLPTLENDPKKESDYEFLIYGGDRPENHVGYEVRRRIPLDVMQALRDAESDLARWRSSPLRPLLDEVAGAIDEANLKDLAEAVTTSTEALAERDEIKALADRINRAMKSITGQSQSLMTSLGFAPTAPDQLIRALRLFIDGGKRGVSDASLGSANVLYLALKNLELDQLVEQGQREHTFLAIEEPEAHLHPHLQRLVYRHYLRPRQPVSEEAPSEAKRTVLLTTHSPHIVSVSPLKSLVLLRKSNDGSTARSTAKVKFSPKTTHDLERYLDVTRGEMLFSKGVLLVEGDAERFVVPVLAKLNGHDLDELGITVCSVSGTNFEPYIKLLGEKGLRVPHAVLTDFDPTDDGSLGEDRVVNQLIYSVVDSSTWDNNEYGDLLKMGEPQGFFLNEHTFEVDLFKSGQHENVSSVLKQLTENEAAKGRAKNWGADPSTLDAEQFLKDLAAIGKGRFAQRVASTIFQKQVSDCPEYILKAVRYVADRCK